MAYCWRTFENRCKCFYSIRCSAPGVLFCSSCYVHVFVFRWPMWGASPMSGHSRSLENIRSNSKTHRYWCLKTHSVLCQHLYKSWFTGALWELFIQLTLAALWGPTYWLDFFDSTGQVLPQGASVEVGEVNKLLKIDWGQFIPVLLSVSILDSAEGTPSSTLQPLTLHLILLSHIYPSKTPGRHRS